MESKTAGKFALSKIFVIGLTALNLMACGKDGGGGGEGATATKAASTNPIERCREQHTGTTARNKCYQDNYKREIDRCLERNPSNQTKLNECYDQVQRRYNTVASVLQHLRPHSFNNGFYHPSQDPFYISRVECYDQNNKKVTCPNNAWNQYNNAYNNPNWRPLFQFCFGSGC